MMTMQSMAHAEELLEILVPPEHLSTHMSHLCIVGRSSYPALEVYRNGELFRTVSVADSVFHVQVHFGYGLNDFTVIPLAGNSIDSCSMSATIEIMNGPTISRDFGRFYVEYSFHDVEHQEKCLRCHENQKRLDSSAGNTEWCYSCHENMKTSFRSHIPRDEKACAQCHPINADLSRPLKGDFTDQNPCYSCHTDKIGEFAQEFIHGPVAGGTCTVCHNPHGSIFENGLKSPVSVLCYSCHSMDRYDRLRVKHRPFERGLCSKCHDPHATNHRWGLVRNSHELCLNCHEHDGSLEEHRHPFGVRPKSMSGKKLLLTETGELECLSCHEAHATDSPHLLRMAEENSCGGCHPDLYQ